MVGGAIAGPRSQAKDKYHAVAEASVDQVSNNCGDCSQYLVRSRRQHPHHGPRQGGYILYVCRIPGRLRCKGRCRSQASSRGARSGPAQCRWQCQWGRQSRWRAAVNDFCGSRAWNRWQGKFVTSPPIANWAATVSARLRPRRRGTMRISVPRRSTARPASRCHSSAVG